MKKALLVSVLSLLLISCAQTKSGVSSGVFYSSWKDTISANVDNSVVVKKQGEACAVNILGIVATGDSSVEAAKRNGRIKKVSYADTTYFSILFGIFQKGCTVVKGN